jgi:twitching motility protein PilT
MNINKILNFCVTNNVSDFHISTGVPPMVRVDGEMRQLNVPPFDHTQVCDMINELLNERQRKEYQKNLNCEFSYTLPGVARFRVIAYLQNRGAGMVIRTIPLEIPSFEQLENAPPILKKFAMTHQGIILVTGGAGSGRSTTLAAMINYRNENESGHILTIEEPIEFVHESKRSLITQCEVKRDTYNFDNALRTALHQDADVILVGEMRDLETIRLALMAAETGHAVFSTWHTTITISVVISSLVEVFPTDEKPFIRTRLSETLQGVVLQKLLNKIGGGRVAAYEIMVSTGAVRNLIRENKMAQMYGAMQTGQRWGMQTLDNQLDSLLKRKLITKEEALKHALNKDKFA